MNLFSETIHNFDEQLKKYYDGIFSTEDHFNEIIASINYSLFSGGKRYRPLLSLATAQLFKLDPEVVMPLAIAVESIHTYSLIHDDLPCMDNDDMRRGKPTNHKKFGEDLALLAGDSLISEGLSILVREYSQYKNFKSLFLEFSNSIGVNGMIGGQVLDLKLKRPSQKEMKTIHLLKTGQLIKLSIKSVGYLAEASSEQLKGLEKMSLNLGYAFQLKDDLQDIKEPGSDDEANMVHLLGLSGAQQELEKVTKEIYLAIDQFDAPSEDLERLIAYNLKRDI